MLGAAVGGGLVALVQFVVAHDLGDAQAVVGKRRFAPDVLRARRCCCMLRQVSMAASLRKNESDSILSGWVRLWKCSTEIIHPTPGYIVWGWVAR
ncbi:hypothetical protein RSP795_19325 [Ralstonia solanacearum]|nr:hypothetical protein RSP795_19325 [Ralstonia solanacearum]